MDAKVRVHVGLNNAYTHALISCPNIIIIMYLLTLILDQSL